MFPFSLPVLFVLVNHLVVGFSNGLTLSAIGKSLGQSKSFMVGVVLVVYDSLSLVTLPYVFSVGWTTTVVL